MSNKKTKLIIKLLILLNIFNFLDAVFTYYYVNIINIAEKANYLMVLALASQFGWVFIPLKLIVCGVCSYLIYKKARSSPMTIEILIFLNVLYSGVVIWHSIIGYLMITGVIQ